MSLTGEPTKRRSNAKNAYDLMSDIKEYILEEPKRVFMGDWLITDMSDIEDIFETTGPACGTFNGVHGSIVRSQRYGSEVNRPPCLQRSFHYG